MSHSCGNQKCAANGGMAYAGNEFCVTCSAAIEAGKSKTEPPGKLLGVYKVYYSKQHGMTMVKVDQ